MRYKSFGLLVCYSFDSIFHKEKEEQKSRNKQTKRSEGGHVPVCVGVKKTQLSLNCLFELTQC